MSRRVGGLLAGLGGGANLTQFATGAVGVARNAGVMGEFFEQVDEFDASVLGNGPLQHRAQGVDVGFVDSQAFQRTSGLGVDRDRVATERLPPL